MAAESVTFGRALHFDEAAAVVHDDVHVRLGLRVLGVVEIEHRHAVADAHRDRGDLAMQREVAMSRFASSASHASASAT